MHRRAIQPLPRTAALMPFVLGLIGREADHPIGAAA